MDTATAIATLQRHPAQFEALASMKDINPGTAEAIMQLIPFGDRKILEALGIVRAGMPLGNGLSTLEVTEFGWDVIEACPDLDVG